MSETVFLGVAWPYPNGSLHLGQIAGAYLAPDIFARYHRTAGNRVLMVSGSDQHGTPITVRAEQEGRTPQQVATSFHEEFVASWERLGISFDLYTTTGTQNHIDTVQEMFLKLLEQGDIYKAVMELPYCAQENRFLLDRYVEGTCPFCGFERARGDQCDNCGRILDPVDLIDPRCRFDGSAPERRESEHFFLRLSAYNDRVKAWLTDDKEHWRRNVLGFALGILNDGEGLKDRAITRDMQWGVPIPVEGYDDKRIYVWFENVVGYLSAAKEWAQREGTPEAWRDFWQDPETKSYYFIGKDNIWFHTLSWPAQIMMYGGLNLPYDVPANQYINFRGWKASTSMGTAPFLPVYLERYDPDTIRYYLAAIMPESSDSDFSEGDLVRRNNEELVSTWGNLVNRVLTITYRSFEGRIPEPGALHETDRVLLRAGEEMLTSVGASIAACRFREGLRTSMAYAQETNRYLNQEEPWKTRESDPPAAARALYTALGAIEALKLALYPYLPFSAQQLHAMLGHDGPIDFNGWQTTLPQAGRPLGTPAPLFKKLEPPSAAEPELVGGKEGS
ncbi:MAG: methionine--tRNA ligase [Dehalococcoidia bacterium]|nr:methionine--tRNA ligase [Dehalococcoidia bacterium]